jgi:hypothetical protein
MKLSSLWRKPNTTDMLDTMLASAKRELADAEMQRVLAVDALHTADASIRFHQDRLKMLEGMQGVPKGEMPLTVVTTEQAV